MMTINPIATNRNIAAKMVTTIVVVLSYKVNTNEVGLYLVENMFENCNPDFKMYVCIVCLPLHRKKTFSTILLLLQILA